MSLRVIGIIAGCCAMAAGQPAGAPVKFDAADVHVSPKSTNSFGVRIGAIRAGRYEIKNATMVDLVRLAYGFDADKILGGPSWLEMNRYDLIAKVPSGTTPETQKQMMQALLEERFKLAAHKDSRPLPAFALVVAKKPQMKEASGSEEPACKVDENGGPIPGGTTIMIGAAVAASMGVPPTLHLGPGGTIEYHCRNITMASFAEKLRSLMGANLGSSPITDDTGLKGAWNFDVRWSAINMGGDSTERITASDALEKQLGLKLETRQVPTPVMVVDSVRETPAPNPPGTAELLPVIPPPTEFEVASVKPAEPGGRGGNLRNQPGGRVTAQNAAMRLLLMQAFNSEGRDQIVNWPAWADSERFDITAKAPTPDPNAPPLDAETMSALMRRLLVDRFLLKYHTEERPMDAYSLVAAKPKLKKADPTARASCKYPNPPAGNPAGSRMVTCQNVTMEQFAEKLQRMTAELVQPVLDETEIEGTWDVSIIFNPNPSMAGGRGGAEGGAAPDGSYTIFEALEKLGLKLEKRKRPVQVVVIDHLDQRPTEN